jgi:prepilin-type N-terminal cleavage/methylation domain-containing protein/prepilin-type processing-associated H-X9-DG protein
MSLFRRTRRAGFTLIELLVVIAIIAILVGLILPAIQKVREAAARVQCQNNLKQLGLAFHNYHDANEAFPPAMNYLGKTDVGYFLNASWLAYLLPYIEQDPLYRFVISNPTYDPNYWGLPSIAGGNPLATPVPTFICPTDPSSTHLVFQWADTNLGSDGWGTPTNAYSRGSTSYVGFWCNSLYNGGNEPNHMGILSYISDGNGNMGGSLVRMTDVTDGTSNTFLAAELPPDPSGGRVWGNYAGAWEPPFTWEEVTRGVGSHETGFTPADPTSWSGNFGSYHPGGANFVFADGSVHFLNYSIGTTMMPDGSVLLIEALATFAGGEVVNGNSY